MDLGNEARVFHKTEKPVIILEGRFFYVRKGTTDKGVLQRLDPSKPRSSWKEPRGMKQTGILPVAKQDVFSK